MKLYFLKELPAVSGGDMTLTSILCNLCHMPSEKGVHEKYASLFGDPLNLKQNKKGRAVTSKVNVIVHWSHKGNKQTKNQKSAFIDKIFYSKFRKLLCFFCDFEFHGKADLQANIISSSFGREKVRCFQDGRTPLL